MPPKGSKHPRPADPNSAASRLAVVVKHACHAARHGLTAGEIATAWRDRVGEAFPADLKSALMRLRRRGDLESEAYMIQTVRFRHRDEPVPYFPPDAFEPLVARLVAEHFAATGRPAKTGEIRVAMRALGREEPYPGATTGTVWNLAFTRPGLRRAPTARLLEVRIETDSPRAHRGYLPNTAAGQAFAALLSAYTDAYRAGHPEWFTERTASSASPGAIHVPFQVLLAALDAAHPGAPHTPPAARAAVRSLVALLPRATVVSAAVHCTVAELGLPAHHWHVRLWRLAQPDGQTTWRSLGRAALQGVVRDLRNASERASAKREGGYRHLARVVAHPLTAHGIFPPRLLGGDADAEVRAAVALDDAAQYLRVAAELAGLTALAQDPWARPPFATDLPAVRRAVLRTAVEHAMHPCRASDLPTLLPRLERAWDTTARWAEHFHRHSAEFSEWRLRVATAHENFAALVALLGPGAPSATRSPTAEPLGVIGAPGTTVRFADLDPVLREMATLRGADVGRRPYTLFKNARRCVSGRGPHEVGVLDRADALLGLFAALPLPRAAALLDHGHAALGHVLRDRAVLEDLLARTPPAAAASRRALVVALGMIGAAPAWGDAVPGGEDGLDAAAFVLAVVCTTLDAGRAAAAVAAAMASARGAARAVLAEAAAQLRSGDLLTAVG
ncbi:hypothetical protein [Roseisolibacter agri]|uniref:Uncharacterized protein n=1 Tax=Roseisolibacter agri TaxID=2014610 RepID=A0AA37V4R7_9BACT|nr:hypothetical protein [Roseisolibacter agri]GLC28287.1 hypothetical protein rosag_48000 [Roseisolibacter agri]